MTTALEEIPQHAVDNGWDISGLGQSPLWYCQRQYLYKGRKFIVIEYDQRGAIEYASLWAAGYCFALARGQHKRRKVFGWIRDIGPDPWAEKKREGNSA